MTDRTRSVARGGRVGFFSLGVAVGLALAIAGTATTVRGDDLNTVKQIAIYAISALAIDTEKNARAIVDLRDRIEDLEARLAEIAARGK
jgi:hypothetical protein